MLKDRRYCHIIISEDINIQLCDAVMKLTVIGKIILINKTAGHFGPAVAMWFTVVLSTTGLDC